MSLVNKKILYINGVAGIRSTGRIVCQLAQGVIDGGGDACICYGRNIYNGPIKAYKFIKNIEVNINALTARLLDNEGCGLKGPTNRLIDIIKEFNPDIIHLHNIHGYYINYIILFNYIKESKIKVVWTLHDCWPMTGHCSHFEYVGCDRWKEGCYNCPNKKEYPSSILLDNSKKQYLDKKAVFTSLDKNQMIIVTPSKWLKNLVEQSYLSKYKVEVINTGINLDNFKPTENANFKDININNKKILLGVAVPFIDKKGYKDFIKLNNMIDKDKYQIVLVGVNENQQKELSDEGIIGILKTDNQSQLAELYSLATCLLNLTYEDTFPTVNIEAIACGCPIITYKTGGSPEVILDTNGRVVKQGDLESVCKKIIEVETLDRRKVIGQVGNQYTVNNMISNYLNVYNEVL